jgi:hypothetical protein
LNADCGDKYKSWEGIVNYVIAGSIKPVSAPTTPSVSGRGVTDSTGPGVHFEFKSTAAGSSRILACQYQIERLASNGRWTTIYKRGWERSIRDVRTEITYHTPVTQRYRIRSWNPGGWTSYVNVNGSSPIAPG